MSTVLAGYIRADNYQEVLQEDGTLRLVIDKVRQDRQVSRDELEALIREGGRTKYNLYLETEAFRAIQERAFQGRLFDLEEDGVG